MRFEGIYTPIITPFHADGSVDWDGYGDVIDWQIENGVAGVIIGGSTGEFYAMSKEERLAQFRFAASRINGRIEFMAGVNDIRVDECLEITAAARDAGAQSLLVAAPPYALPSESELAAHVLKVADTSGLSIMLYNYPGRTGVQMGTGFLDIVAAHPLIAGIKESSGDYTRLPLLARSYSDIELVIGGEEQVLEFAAWGARAWVCASANIFPSECVQFMDLLASGDFAKGRRVMSAFMPLTGILEQGPAFLQCVKQGCDLRGRPSGPVRPPLMAMHDGLKQEMAEIVAATEKGVHAALKG
jgi:4-hydroxy-tetrahydrodipicolinate synthase